MIPPFSRKIRPSVLDLADRARDAAEWDLAARHYRAVLDRDPRNPAIWVQYGHALKEAGGLKDPAKLAEAETAYRRALAYDPHVADTHLQLGHVLKLQGRTQESEAAYLRASIFDPLLRHPTEELRALAWSEGAISELMLASGLQNVDPAPAQEAALRILIEEHELFATVSGRIESILPRITTLASAPNGKPASPAAVDGLEIGELRQPEPADKLELDADQAQTMATVTNGAASGVQSVNGSSAEDRVLMEGFWGICEGMAVGQVSTVRKVPVDVTLLVDSEIVGSFVLAPDTADFLIRIPINLADDRPHAVEVAVEGDKLFTGPELSNAATYQRSIRLQIDDVKGGLLHGWAYDVRQPAEPVKLELLDGNSLVGRTETKLRRPDVNKAYGIDGNHGFSLWLPRSVFDGRPHNLKYLCRSEVVSLKAFRGVPEIFLPGALDNSPNRCNGRIENASCKIISGWAIDYGDTDRPANVSIYVDEHLAGTVAARRFNPRFREIGSGFQGFRWRPPSSLMDGRKHTVVARHDDKTPLTMSNDRTRSEVTVDFPLVHLDNVRPPDLASRRFQFRAPQQILQLAPSPVTDRNLGSTSPESAVPEISVIVLNLNGAHLLEEFFQSWIRIAPRTPYELILIDHGSTDDSLKIMDSYSSALPLRIFERGQNYAFSASSNFGAELARGRYLVFANNDLVMVHDCITPMAEHLERDANIGMVGVKLVEPLPADAGSWALVPHHVGIQFVPVVGAAAFGLKALHYPEEIADECGEYVPALYDMPAVTAALSMCRKRDFAAVGGFYEPYFYGMEDVDLCLTMREQLKLRIVCDTGLCAIHHRSATREDRVTRVAKEQPTSSRSESALDNGRKLALRHSRRLKRQILASLVAGETYWRQMPLRVTFVVTEASIKTAAGDLFTAMELGEAMRDLFGWEVMFAEMTQTNIDGTDVLVVMRHDYHLRRVINGNPGLVTVAWIRNRVDQWLASAHFPAYNLIFCSSEKARRQVRERANRDPLLLPIASNANRFRPSAADPALATDIVFTGHFWGAARDAVDQLDPDTLPYNFAIYGTGWGASPRWSRYCRGSLRYDELPPVYASAKIVLDDSHPVTRDWNSLNSRVFDVLASGTLVITNCRGGAEEVFGDLLPTFSTPEELRGLIDFYMTHAEERERRAAALSQIAREHHSYRPRAAAFRSGLAQFVSRSLRFGIKVGIPRAAERENWGDWHFATGIKQALERRGHFARIDILPEWDLAFAAGDDVSLSLRGLSEYEPSPSMINIAWLISHPEKITVEELRRYDHVFVASERFCDELTPGLGGQVSPLLQCSDTGRFFPETDPVAAVPETIFVGNSRGQQRQIVTDALNAGVEFAVYGTGWEGRVAEPVWRGPYIPNESLRFYYSGAGVVLNDHWPHMAQKGFISNRIFDAAACGATIVSDDAVGLSELFGDDVIVYREPDELGSKIRDALADTEARIRRRARLTKLIAENHTFDHRIDAILGVAERLLASV